MYAVLTDHDDWTVSHQYRFHTSIAESLKYKMSVKQVVAVGMGIIMFYILAAAAIGSVIYAEISKVLSK